MKFEIQITPCHSAQPPLTLVLGTSPGDAHLDLTLTDAGGMAITAILDRLELSELITASTGCAILMDAKR
jgi:hypothetical protein